MLVELDDRLRLLVVDLEPMAHDLGRIVRPRRRTHVSAAAVARARHLRRPLLRIDHLTAAAREPGGETFDELVAWDVEEEHAVDLAALRRKERGQRLGLRDR